MRAELDEFLVVLLTGILLDVVLLAETQRANDGQWHLAHAELGGHGGEVSLEGEVHQGRVDDVVLMVAEGYLGASQFLGKVKELLTTLPRTEEAGRLTFK